MAGRQRSIWRWAWLVAALPGCTSTSNPPSPDGITPGIERPVDGVSISFNETVRTGKTLNTYQTTSIDDGCKFYGYPKVTVVRRPEHGTFTFTRGLARPNVAKSSRCYDVRIPHVLGHYRPDPGFVGTDRVTIRGAIINGGFSYATINIRVTP